ncbi:MAG: response regulator [Proteobacteria bacterium]|nr:MAG: response regulator [Pseudomonadota bacterium]
MSALFDAATQTHSLRVLLAEDEPGDRELLEIAMMRSGGRCKIETVEDGVEAMEYLRFEGRYARAVRPDIVILDLNLPRKDGREVLKEMKADESLREIPVIVLSTSYDDGDIRSSYRLGASSYIVKPGNFRDFNVLIQKLSEYWFSSVTLPRRV